MNSSRRQVENIPPKENNVKNEQEPLIKQIIILLNTNSITNKDELFNCNPIKFKIQLDPREINYIKELMLLPFYIPRIKGLDNSDKIYISIDELIDTTKDAFHFVCMIEIYNDTILIKPQNTYKFYDNSHRIRSNIVSVSFKLYDHTLLSLDYSFSVGVKNAALLSQELINYIEGKKIHAELLITYC
jgi:hypothetical protein